MYIQVNMRCDGTVITKGIEILAPDGEFRTDAELFGEGLVVIGKQIKAMLRATEPPQASNAVTDKTHNQPRTDKFDRR